MRSLRLLLTASIMILPAAASTQTAAGQAASASATATGPVDAKVRCKRYTITGSLAQVRKECHTEAEWRQLAEANRSELRNMVNRGAAPGVGPQ
jgi:hypothetical protein